jgi:hypothetical protein
MSSKKTNQEDLRNYWEKELSELSILEMVTDKERAPILSATREVVEFCIHSDLANQIKELCLSQGQTIVSGLLTTFAICLCRHTTQAEVSIGHHMHDLQLENGEVAIIVEVSGNSCFFDVLNFVVRKLNAAAAHQTTFPNMIKIAGLQPDSRRNLIFQTYFNYNGPNVPSNQFDIHNNNICEFILDFEENITDGTLFGKLYYSVELYERETAQQFADHFQILLAEYSRQPTIPFDAVPLLTSEEIQEYIQWNTTDVDFGSFTRVDRMFEHIAAVYPHNEALRLDGVALTFQQVNIAAHELANKLFGRGIEIHEKVGLVLDRSFDMFVAILAVLKVGAVIVPIDIAHTPMDRIEYMFSDSAVRFIIIHDVHISRLIDTCSKFIILSWLELKKEDISDDILYRPPELDQDLDALFGIFYTSGTTGRPKGVMNMHRNIFNLVKAYSRYSNIQPTDRILQFASYSFIQSLRQI